MKHYARESKFKSERIQYQGRSFASKGEAGLFQYLKALEAKGELKIVALQPNVTLSPFKIKMIPDFLVRYLNSEELVYVEYKGFETDVYKIKREIWKVIGPGKLVVYKGYGSGLTITETIIPQGLVIE